MIGVDDPNQRLPYDSCPVETRCCLNSPRGGGGNGKWRNSKPIQVVTACFNVKPIRIADQGPVPGASNILAVPAVQMVPAPPIVPAKRDVHVTSLAHAAPSTSTTARAKPGSSTAKQDICQIPRTASRETCKRDTMLKTPELYVDEVQVVTPPNKEQMDDQPQRDDKPMEEFEKDAHRKVNQISKSRKAVWQVIMLL